MKEYIVKRVFLAVVTIFVISAITFFAMNLIPGGPFNTEKALSPAVRRTLQSGQTGICSVRYVSEKSDAW